MFAFCIAIVKSDDDDDQIMTTWRSSAKACDKCRLLRGAAVDGPPYQPGLTQPASLTVWYLLSGICPTIPDGEHQLFHLFGI